MLFSRRAPIDRTPAEVGLAFEDVAFKAGDGVDLKGWFIPSGESPAPAVVLIHGWMWNRLGNVAGKVPIDDRDVDFLPVTKSLHDAGFHVLLFDLRGHGESGRSRHLLTFGPIEARDFVGAVNYLRSRADVDGQRIGALGISMGGSIALHGAPDCQPIKALLAYQPSTVPVFNANFCEDQFGKLGKPLPMGVELIYRLWRSPPPSSQYPGAPARKLDGTIVHYAQGTGDKWGTMADVESMHAGTPHTDGPVERFESTGRYDGYRYVVERREFIADFFKRNV
jgi:pimeloyl-ACP methyl ester carboxylesterase